MSWRRTLDLEMVSSHRPADDVGPAAKHILIQRAEMDGCKPWICACVHATRAYGAASTCQGSYSNIKHISNTKVEQILTLFSERKTQFCSRNTTIDTAVQMMLEYWYPRRNGNMAVIQRQRFPSLAVTRQRSSTSWLLSWLEWRGCLPGFRKEMGLWILPLRTPQRAIAIAVRNFRKNLVSKYFALLRLRNVGTVL
jgi:hypothetical protein